MVDDEGGGFRGFAGFGAGEEPHFFFWVGGLGDGFFGWVWGFVGVWVVYIWRVGSLMLDR